MEKEIIDWKYIKGSELTDGEDFLEFLENEEETLNEGIKV